MAHRFALSLHVLTEPFPHMLLYAAYPLDNNTSFFRMIVKINQLNFRQPTIVIAKALNTYGVQFMRSSLNQKMPRHTDRSFYGHAPAWNCPDPIVSLQAQLLQLRHLTLCKRIMSCIQPWQNFIGLCRNLFQIVAGIWKSKKTKKWKWFKKTTK